MISEIDLTNDRVELVNSGGSAVDLTGWWWCNLVNGSPAYGLVTSNSTVDVVLSSAGASLTNFGAGQVLVLDITDTDFIQAATGEFSLYTTNSFGSSAAIEDYVSWGPSDGVRDSVAEAAGLWTDDQQIDISGIQSGETLQANPSTNGDGAGQWSIGANTLGATNVPEPSVSLLALGASALLMRRRR